MNRVEKLREYVDEILLNKNNNRDRRMAYVHLYGVAQSCALIAKKRGVDIELAIMAGMLHDLYTYKKKDEVRHLGMDAINEVIKNHRVDGTIYVREILSKWQLTTDEETNIICDAIQGGVGKDNKSLELEKVVNDANIMQFYLYNPISPELKLDEKRVDNLLTEFGLTFA
jgi:uncharacterized protein